MACIGGSDSPQRKHALQHRQPATVARAAGPEQQRVLRVGERHHDRVRDGKQLVDVTKQRAPCETGAVLCGRKQQLASGLLDGWRREARKRGAAWVSEKTTKKRKSMVFAIVWQ